MQEPSLPSHLDDETLDERSPATGQGGGDPYLYTTQLTAGQLRHFLRQHLMWLFGGCSLLVIAFLLPTTTWYFHVTRGLLFVGGLFVGGTRLLQINGIIDELDRRGEGLLGAGEGTGEVGPDEEA